MPATPITDPVTGESLVGIEPQLQQQVDPGWWRERLNLYNGRALTVDAFDSEQNYRAGLLTTMGQAVTAGTVTGLALTMDTSRADPMFSVSPGYGIMANGQDIALNTTLKTHLSTLTVIDPVTGSDLYTFRQSVGDPKNITHAGILLLQPVIAQVSGQQLDTGALPTIVSGNLGASCSQDPAEYAFEDWQIADAVRLVYLPWPTGIPNVTNLQLPPMAPEATWRNRLAYAIFEAEALLGPDDQLPWAMLGLPVALIAFDPGAAWAANTAYTAGQYITDFNSNVQTVKAAGTSGAAQPTNWSTVWGGLTTDDSVTWVNSGLAWKPLFVDCNAVVRAGGLPRNRYVLPAQPPPLLQWQPQTKFAANEYMVDSNGNVQVVQTAGTTGAVPPQWNTNYGQTTKDGTVVWTNNGPASWQPNTNFQAGQFILDETGNQQQVFTPGTSGTVEPDWNGVYLPTTDGSVTWLNNGTGNPPIVQPALAQARINQLSEQLSQTMAAGQSFTATTLADVFSTLPPSGILPVQALNFTNQTAPWLPPNWTVSAAPVLLEELETVLETGMLMDPIAALTAAPEDGADLEPVEVLVPLPDAVYDPNILVTDTVPEVFYQELEQATDARNLTLKQLQTVQSELNTLYAAIGPNLPSNPNLIDPDLGLTPGELSSRNTPPPYTPTSSEVFGTVLQSTWETSSLYSSAQPSQFVIDSNGAMQVALTTGTTSSTAPDWSTTIGQTTSDGVVWIARGKTAWQAKTRYTVGQVILDPQGNIQQVATPGTSGTTAPNFTETTTVENAVTWKSGGNAAWQPSSSYSHANVTLDPNGNIQMVTGVPAGAASGTSGTATPQWNKVPGQTTSDNNLTWTNLGYTSWQPNTQYSVNAAIVDSSGAIEIVAAAGISGSSAPQWNSAANSTTTDGLTWSSQGNAKWQANTAYSVGAVILDANGAIQQVQTAGTSGTTAQPAWNDTPGGTTNDAAIIWLNNGPWAWQPNTAYVVGQFVIDPEGFRQTVMTAGTSAAEQPDWLPPKPAGSTTTDNKVVWTSGGKAFWQPNTTYAVGNMIVDAAGNVQSVQTAGKSGASVPYWDPNFNQLTQDGGAVWRNLGHASWQPNTNYTSGQVILDSTGSIQTVTTAGESGANPPDWLIIEGANQTTPDCIIWQAGGNAKWQQDFLYSTGQLILDARGNIQKAQSGGISGDAEPAWNSNPGQTTQDSGVVWINLGHFRWQPNTSYSTGQAILDSNVDIQIASVGGTSGPTQPKWSEGGSSTTIDTSVTWRNDGPLTWLPKTTYSAGKIIVDSNGNLQFATVLDANGDPQPIGTQGVSGTSEPVWSTVPSGTTTDGTIIWNYLAYFSTDLEQVTDALANAPYTTTFTDSTGTEQTISLLSDTDLNNLKANGLQALVNNLNARISQANDLLDTAFLTAQTDIYRFRNSILGTNAAATLATSTVLANIATGESASATAENLQNYFNTVLPAAGSTTTTTTSGTGSGPTTTTTSQTTQQPPVYTRPTLNQIYEPVVLANNPIVKSPILKAPPLQVAAKAPSVRSLAVSAALSNLSATAASTIARTTTTAAQSSISKSTTAAVAGLAANTNAFTNATALESGLTLDKSVLAGPAQIVVPGKNAPAQTSDITGQSPLSGAQLNIRSLTIAQRMQQSPSQEAMFYAISNRLNFLQALQTIENDLNLVADDLPILVDQTPTSTTTTPSGVPAATHYFSEYLGAGNASIIAQIQAPYFVSDASEATLFSVGVRVVEQHTMLLRALEARVQQYSDFVNLCTTALNNMRTDIQKGKAYVAQLTNNLLQDRQNVAFTNALLQDEIQQVQATNAQRQQVLATSVQLIAYTRARTLEATDTVPSRQLVPANVANPVPACLQQSVAIPPELREIVAQLREAPVNWMPSVSARIRNLERPTLLQQLAISTQARAAQLLQLAQLPSSAAGETGAFASTIANLYNANQQMVHTYVAQRAAIQPAALVNLSWSQQIVNLQSIVAVNDLIASESVHTEVSNAVARLIQQISTVSTCLYTRVSIAQPVDRLTWANYLTGSGRSVQLQSLAILPSWNDLTYTDRQQMQMLVDWLFLQIDTSNSSAVSFMSDVVRTAILLASDVPVDNIIPAVVVTRVQPSIGNNVTLSLPSDRVASGMYVNLYSGATLAARAVVSDLDASTVTAKVTDVFTPGVYLETNDSAHFTTLTPQAVALRPLMLTS
jgi:hypothetical protein